MAEKLNMFWGGKSSITYEKKSIVQCRAFQLIIPKQFFSTQAGQVEVADVRVDHDQDAEYYTD